MIESVLDQELVRNLCIPPRPEIVTVLYEEMSRDAPNFPRISKCITADVGLSAAMLKVANSPALGLATKAKSVARAIDILGLRNVSGIATGLIIRHSLSKGASTAALERFWQTAENTALICARLAKRLRGIAPDEAYTLGLFHDCGIPILMQHHPRYKSVLEHAMGAGNRDIMTQEEEAVGTHHGAVGYFLARSWQLPDDLCRTILWHHDLEVFEDPLISETVRNFVGLIHLAEHVHHQMMRSTVDAEWEKFEDAITAHFGLTEEDIVSLTDDANDALIKE